MKNKKSQPERIIENRIGRKDTEPYGFAKVDDFEKLALLKVRFYDVEDQVAFIEFVALRLKNVANRLRDKAEKEGKECPKPLL